MGCIWFANLSPALNQSSISPFGLKHWTKYVAITNTSVSFDRIKKALQSTSERIETVGNDSNVCLFEVGIKAWMHSEFSIVNKFSGH